MIKDLFRAFKEELAAPNKEMARALPDNKGSETPKQLKTYNTALLSQVVLAGNPHLLYTAENWVKIRVTLTTAALAVIGTNEAILPVSSARGIPLAQGEAFEVTIPRATTIYVACEADSRISLVIEPMPWMEQISNEILAVGRGVVGSIEALLRGVSILAGRDIFPPEEQAPKRAPERPPERAKPTFGRLPTLPSLPPLRRVSNKSKDRG